MAYNKKKYIRINWKNRPSTATALGATNLNHMDVFLNDVDNALIEMDSGKLNVETANSMIASITFDKDKGLMTVRELNGTTYTYDWNVEKIPVSFSLSEDGILTMTTQDGTQFTANIADLIKDYVFDDSDTIAFTKEFQTEDNSYHVGASVKNGSIKAEHLDPDYRTDIQNFSNVAQTAANDALTYSKDSKRWAVGDASYEGSETDNSKYYKEQAENARDAAEKARDEAQAATGAVIMAPGVLGVGKPDNTTIKVTEDGTMSVPKATSDSYGLVKPDNTTIGQEDGAIRLIAKAASLLVTDTQGFVGDKNSETNVQLLIDAIADKMVKQLVSNSALTQQLANYVAKSMMSNIQVNDTDKVPTSALAYAMQQAITANANGITQLNNNLRNVDAVVKGSLLDYAKNVNTFENVSTGEPTTDIPDSARYCIAHIMCRANSWFISVEGRDNRLYMNYNNGTDWTGWNSTALNSDLQHYPEVYLTNGLKKIALQLYKYSDSTYILQIILITSTFTKTINLAEFTI